MIYKPNYTITVDGVQVNFLFVSYTFRAFSERKKVELEDLFKIISKTLTPPDKQGEELKDVQPLKTSDFPDILLAANEAWCLYHKIPFSAGIPDAYQWIDAMGGLVGGMQARNELINRFVAKLLNIDEGVIETKAETAPKNGQAPVGQGSPGDGSTEWQPPQA